MLSSRGKYATRALLDLTLHSDAGPVQIHDIAARQKIPVKFLEQILLSLKRFGFVQSRKGPGGGYTLAMPPENITLGAVVRAMDGPLAPISCVSVSGYMECGCPDPTTCGLRAVWKEARDALAEVLDSTTFADIRDRHRSLREQCNEILDYVI
ncbi:MAG TPA: Rrf2 family transcriptional regulator [Chthonomonadaceae bacterium]|nr:Rrf2 family transcriptional regulator [Chthonomonadaceae bacterium]